MNDTQMATYYPNSTSQMDVLSSTPYDQKFSTYSESHLLNNNMMMYLNQDISPVNTQNGVEINPMTGRNEMMFIPPTMSVPLNTEELQLTSRGNIGISDGEHNLQGLSLSLSTHMSTAISCSSFQYQYPNPGLSSVLSPHHPLSAENSVKSMLCKVDETSPSKDMRSSDYFSYDMNEDGHNTISFGPPNNNNNNNSQYAKGMNCIPYQYEQVGVAGLILKSKYRKIAQELLDEVVNVRDALKRPELEKDKSLNKGDEVSKESKGGSLPSEMNESGSGSGSSHELSHAERQDLQSKLDRLHSMLDEVDRRYKQYCHQMQTLVSSFDMVAGGGSAKPYTALALKTISRHFRCLRDAITAQIQATRRNLGEQDNGVGVIPRLRYVDQQLRQQRALQQFGMMRHSWRPQRGLPENAVTVLRAWLFEHFLNPYPKDSEKLMLARQTGLTRGQVANWFINARVRLWKPMVEEMYKEEFGDGDINTPKLTTEKSWGSEEKRDEMHDSSTSIPDDHHDSKMVPIMNPGSQTKEPTTSLSTPGFHIGAFGSSDHHHGFFNNTIPHDPNTRAHAHVMVASSGYQIPELGNFNVGNDQVSLALGLQHHEGSTTEGTVGEGASDYSFLDQVNQQQHQHRFGNSHILNHFVA